MINVLFFGPLRDVTRTAQEARELSSPATLGELFDAYAERFPGLRELQHRFRAKSRILRLIRGNCRW